MKRTELDTIFTNKVNEYLARGYVFNTNTMGGSQGEIAHVDLRKDDEILRVVMDREYDWHNGDKIHILVGRNTNHVNLSRESRETVWNSDLEIIEDLVFAKIAENWYASEEEGAAANALKNKRYSSRHIPAEKDLPVTASLIRALKNRKGFTNATRNNITVRRCAAGYKVIMAGRNGSNKQELIRFPGKK